MAHSRHWLVPKAGALALVLVAASQGCGDSESNPQALPSADASIDESGTTVCKPQTCQELGAACGFAPDGCGGKVECGTCATGELCGGGGPNKCGTNPCTPKTCTQLSAACGYASDGCSDAIDCGNCPAPLTCGGNGTVNQCGCRPKSCAELSANCGTAPDECGGAIDCGNCPTGQTCGGGGKNKCGTGTCTPQTCTQLGASCGFVSDQCSKAIDCGNCPGGETCGGQGEVNQCSCMPKTCGQLSASCGKVQNGCGVEMDCGGCPSGQSCGVEKPNQCGGVGGSGGSGGAGGTGGSSGAAGVGGAAGSSCGSGYCGVLEECFNNQFCVARMLAVSGGYSIDATEVTRDQYAAWLATAPATSGQHPSCAWNTTYTPDTATPANGCNVSIWPPGTKGNHPVACLDWCDSFAYCKAVGKRLCGRIGGGTTAWEDWATAAASQWYNACSAGGSNVYPYGSTFSTTKCNTIDAGKGGSVAVGTMPECVTLEGVQDLSGNVREWEDSCNESADPKKGCRLRGGGFYTSGSKYPACGFGGAEDIEDRSFQNHSVGFRCCSDP